MAAYPRTLSRVLDVVFYALIVTTLVALAVAGYVTATGSADVDLAVPVAFVPDAGSVTLFSETYGAGEIVMAQGMASFEEVGDAGHVAQALVMVAVFLVPAYVILHMLRRLVRTVAEGKPFQAKNVARIRIIGLFTVVFELLYGTATFLLERSIASEVTASGVEMASNFSVNPAVIVIGLVIVALAEVFRYGGNLQVESDLTV